MNTAHIKGIALAVAAAVSLSACATNYGEWKFGVPGGYRNTDLGENTWEIIGRTTEYNHAGASADIALYRAAEIATVQGFSHFMVSKGIGTEYRLGSNYGGSSPMGERFDITAVLLENEQGQDWCTTPMGDPCPVFAASDVLTVLGPRLDITRAPQM